ncbi:hypothetical protein HPP92_016810 [Vanilla planifolia]|uniref:SMAX1-like nucleotide binding domain-containing protein n=1 Tax=Vanilla planifolia TaxID=51239 RepID=A0A835US79_VANPL|nr:hypothetical protein HPP92_017395 [Vanilla planifolia]KAG0472264.1 hypothetical protein HPP92_016810 [Vanilla planifolia]
MREAGFSSTNVKQNLEEDPSGGFGMASGTKPGSFLLDSTSIFLPTQFMKPIEKKEDDVKSVLEVMMMRKQKHGKRSGNVVVVGDSVFMAEGVVNELLLRLERGEVPVELRGALVINLQLSYVHLRLMNKVDLETKISDLRRRVFSSLEKGVVLYAGDLGWAVGEEARSTDCMVGFWPVEYLISEIGRLLSDLRRDTNGLAGGAKVWLLASSSYQKYMRCKMLIPSLESLWALQAVVVPSGGLPLSLHAPSGIFSILPKLKEYHFQMLEPIRLKAIEEEEKLICCAECMTNYEKELAFVNKSEPEETDACNANLPCWLPTQKTENIHKEPFIDLLRKWSRRCRSLHPSRISQATSSIHKSLPSNRCKFSLEPCSISFSSLRRDSRKPIVTNLALGNSVFTEFAMSKKGSFVNPRDLSQVLQENIPWQSEVIPIIVDALLDCGLNERKGSWIMIQGNDRIARRRLARVLAASFFGSAERVLLINVRRLGSAAVDLITRALGKDSKAVVLIEDMDWANHEFSALIKDGINNGFLRDTNGKEVDLRNWIFVLTISGSSDSVKVEEDCDGVLRMRLWTEEEDVNRLPPDEKRKWEWQKARVLKRRRITDREAVLDLNVAITGEGEDEEDGVPSGLTHEFYAICEDTLFQAIAMVTLETDSGMAGKIAEGLTARLRRAFEEAVGGNVGERTLVVDVATTKELAAACGFFLENEFERWVKEVFQICIPTVKIGGKLSLEVKGGEEQLVLGFLGSSLPKKITVG